MLNDDEPTETEPDREDGQSLPLLTDKIDEDAEVTSELISGIGMASQIKRADRKARLHQWANQTHVPTAVIANTVKPSVTVLHYCRA